MLHLLDWSSLIVILKRQWAIRVFNNSVADIRVEWTAKAILPLVLTLANKVLSKNVFPVFPAAFIKNKILFFVFYGKKNIIEKSNKPTVQRPLYKMATI